MMGSPEDKGIIPRISADIFQAVDDKLENSRSGDGQMKCLITVSYLEIYNETIKDLLNPSDKQLRIHEHPEHGVFVKGLCELVCLRCNIQYVYA
jgi:hypothetical protein